MTQITYDIVAQKGGWCIACGDIVGPPYYRKGEAIGDAQFIARTLEKSGENVVVLVEGRQPVTASL